MGRPLTGTVTIDGEDYACSAAATRLGNRLSITISFDGLPHAILLLTGRILELGFETVETVSFTSPVGYGQLGLISSADTTLAADLSSFTFEAGFLTEALNTTLSASLSSILAEIEVPAVENAAEFSGLAKKTRLLDPTKINEMGNVFDNKAALFGVSRIPLESNQQLLERIKTARLNLGGSHKEGLVRSMTNDLGLSVFNALRVEIREDAPDEKARLRFFLKDGRIKIYSIWMTEAEQAAGARPTVERETTLDSGLVGTIGLLSNWINESVNFKSTILSSGDLRAACLLDYDSRHLVRVKIPPQHRYNLKYENILPGTLRFSSTLSCSREKGPDETLVEDGEFSIDYATGLLSRFNPRTEEVKATFLISETEFNLPASEVFIRDLTSEESQERLFQQIQNSIYSNIDEMDDNGLPTQEMNALLRRVLSENPYPQYWGE